MRCGVGGRVVKREQRVVLVAVIVASRTSAVVEAQIGGGGLVCGRGLVKLLVPSVVGQRGAKVEPAENRGEHPDPGQRERGLKTRFWYNTGLQAPISTRHRSKIDLMSIEPNIREVVRWWGAEKKEEEDKR